MGQVAPLIVSLAGAAATAYNTEQTNRKQDEQLAASLLGQSRIQKDADAKVAQQVDQLATSSAADERRQRMGEYMQQLRRNTESTTAGLAPTYGSEAFRTDSRQAAANADTYAQRAANLMSRVDAAGMQRQGETFGYGNLATDLGLVQRKSAGQRFVDDLRLRGIRRDPMLDFAAGVADAYASSAGGKDAGYAAGADYNLANEVPRLGLNVQMPRVKAPGVY